MIQRTFRCPRGLITGGSGFIGSHLAEELLRYGYGEQSRGFGYVGLLGATLADLTRSAQAGGEVFNVGDSKEITLIH